MNDLLHVGEVQLTFVITSKEKACWLSNPRCVLGNHCVRIGTICAKDFLLFKNLLHRFYPSNTFEPDASVIMNDKLNFKPCNGTFHHCDLLLFGVAFGIKSQQIADNGAFWALRSIRVKFHRYIGKLNERWSTYILYVLH